MQCEPGRGPYLFELISATGELPYYRGRILAALANPPEGSSVEQLLQLALCLAQQGDSDARQLLYDAFQRSSPPDFDGGDELVRLDGPEGFLFAAQFLARTGREDDHGCLSSWLHLLEERDGKETARQTLESALAQSAEIAAAWERHRQQCEEVRLFHQARKKRVHWAVKPYPEFRRYVRAKGMNAKYLAQQWGKRVPDTDIQLAAEDLLLQVEEGPTVAYLWVFAHRDYPGEPAPLLKLAESSSEEIQWAAYRALARFSHPDVRALALRILEKPGAPCGAISLLLRNYHAGDHELVERQLQTPLNEDHYHSVALHALDLVEAYPEEPWGPALMLLYENDGCGLCRESAVEQLKARGEIPEWMREECRYDSIEEIRTLVEILEESRS